jgi:hypothetical protein
MISDVLYRLSCCAKLPILSIRRMGKSIPLHNAIDLTTASPILQERRVVLSMSDVPKHLM